MFPSTLGLFVPSIGLDIVPLFSIIVPFALFSTLSILPLFSTLTFSELESTSTLSILPPEVFSIVVFLPSFTTKVPILPLFLISAFGAFTVTSPFKSPFTLFQQRYL